MDKVMRLTYSSSLTHFCEMNPSFDVAKLRIAYHGKNRNGSYISKESFERAAPTMYNCPVVCNYKRDQNTIGSHDIEVIREDNGDYKLVNVTTPVGVVPESSKWFWEQVEEENGDVHEYLSTEILLWKRQEAYKKISEDGIEAQSMEIEVKDGWRSNELDAYVINDFSFTAFCLLGESVEPCFESAEVEVYSANMDQFKEQFEQMMNDLKESFYVINSPIPEVENNNNLTEGGEVLDEKLALVQEYGLNIDELDFAIDDLSIEDLKEKFEEMKAEPDIEDVEEHNEPEEPEEPEENFALVGELRDGLREAVAALGTVEMPWGQEPKFWFVDFDNELMEVYAESEEDWHLYGFNYSLNGDNVVIDVATQKRMKWVVAEFDEGEDVTPFAGMFESAVNKYSENDSAWSEKFQTASDTINGLSEELSDLREFKKDTCEAREKAERESVFSRFEDLIGIEAFDNLRENCDGIDLDTIEEKCFAIRGRENTKVTFSRDIKSPKIKIGESAHTNEPYGGAFVEYGVAE